MTIGLTCGMLLPVRVDPDDPRLTAHKLPMEMATETLIDMIGAAQALMEGITNDRPPEELDRIRETARGLFEAYINLMAQAALAARALKPD
ncbi:MAG: hypothetical protein ACK4FB_08125 [Brevundimonas sp.]|uniref:hypothetical protein n=1 Tax=Brevundimonas sp. TaxID=1871086 RepID=UPI00391BE843